MTDYARRVHPCKFELHLAHTRGPGGPGIKPYESVHQCLGVKDHPGRHQFDERIGQIKRG